MTSRELSVLTRVRDAVRDGDAMLAQDLLSEIVDAEPFRPMARCAGCGQRFEWPGQRDAHLESGLCWGLRHAAGETEAEAA